MGATTHDGESENVRRVSLEKGVKIRPGRDGARHRAQPSYPKIDERGSCKYNHACQERYHGIHFIR